MRAKRAICDQKPMIAKRAAISALLEGAARH
jgi:hypothetical protein